jgi:glycosyltransferase involved in cell wall biosynthesis
MEEKPLHICLVTPSYPPEIGGIATYVHDLAASFVGLGQRVTVLNAGGGGGADEELEEAGVRVIRLCSRFSAAQRVVGSLTRLSQMALSLKVYQSLRRLHRRTPFDIVEFPNWKALGVFHSMRKLAPQVVRVTTGIHQITTPAPPDGEGSRKRRSRAALERLLSWELGLCESLTVIRSDAVITPSARHWQSSARFYAAARRRRDNLFFIPLGVHIRRADGGPRERDGGVCNLLYVGRLTHRKGFDTFMAALPAVFVGAEVEVRVTVIGEDGVDDRDGASMWERHSAGLGEVLRARVKYLGRVTDRVREEEYRRCDLFVAPSRYESFGLIYVEAMCHGVPVIGCDVGGVADVIEGGVEGLLAPPGDAPALAGAILRLVNSPELRSRMGRAARLKALERFDRRAMADATLAVYRDVIGRRARKDKLSRPRAAGSDHDCRRVPIDRGPAIKL